ncbi:hypothetical protein T10_1454 [Trichinella papuae]|uniref:Uncharacterized protein n=1 Tax=Trichinella papuae TaxID=268474 RepID=A0A0V1MPY6_9BILA|nr:hypothetical protein T10_1454 [Trichinella papuae]
MDEVEDAVATSSHTVNVILLPPAAGDSGSEDSDIEIIPKNLEEGFEPAEEPSRVRPTSVPCRDSPRWKKTAMFDFPLRGKDIVRCECLQQLAELCAYNVWRCVFTDQMVEYLVDQTTTFHGRRDLNRAAFSPT